MSKCQYQSRPYHGPTTCDTSMLRSSTSRSPKSSIDAELAGNEARFVNDFRITVRQANACFDQHVDERGDLKLVVFYKPDAPIRSGEEILISYGKHRFGDLEEFRTDV